MHNDKVHTSPPEMRPIFLVEYRADQKSISGRIDSVVTVLQSLKYSSYQSKA